MNFRSNTSIKHGWIDGTFYEESCYKNSSTVCKFTKWYNAKCGKNIALEQNEIIYGVLRYTSSSLTLNHLIIIGKYFLYINAVHDEKRPQFTDFVTLVNEKMELEKYIAITTNKLHPFKKVHVTTVILMIVERRIVFINYNAR